MSSFEYNAHDGGINKVGTAKGSQLTGKNLLINGGLQLNERGAGPFTSNAFYTYGPDRWAILGLGPATGTLIPAGVTDPYPQSYRVQRDAGETHAGAWLGMGFELGDVRYLRGQRLTFSALVKFGANYSAPDLKISISDDNAQSEENFVNMADPGNTLTNFDIPAILGGEFVKYSVTHTIADNAVGVGAGMWNNLAGTAGADDWFEVALMQLEVGKVATPFEPFNTIDILGRAKRYYEVMTVQTINGAMWIPWNTEKRDAPVTTITAGVISDVTKYGFILTHTSSVVSTITADWEV